MPEDDKAVTLAEQEEEAIYFAMLAEAGLTVEELEAYLRMRRGQATRITRSDSSVLVGDTA